MTPETIITIASFVVLAASLFTCASVFKVAQKDHQEDGTRCSSCKKRGAETVRKAVSRK